MKFKRVVGIVEIIGGTIMLFLISPIIKLLTSLANIENGLQFLEISSISNPFLILITILSILFILQGIVNMKKKD